jgi:hypothetical protein
MNGEGLGGTFSKGTTQMAFHLVHRYGPRDQPKFCKESFPTEPQAVIRAAQYFMAGDKDDFLIEDDAGRIVTNDLEIRQRCKITRIP